MPSIRTIITTAVIAALVFVAIQFATTGSALPKK